MSRPVIKGDYVASKVGQIRAGIVGSNNKDSGYVYWFLGVNEDDSLRYYMEHVNYHDLEILDPMRVAPGLKQLRRLVVRA